MLVCYVRVGRVGVVFVSRVATHKNSDELIKICLSRLFLLLFLALEHGNLEVLLLVAQIEGNSSASPTERLVFVSGFNFLLRHSNDVANHQWALPPPPRKQREQIRSATNLSQCENNNGSRRNSSLVCLCLESGASKFDFVLANLLIVCVPIQRREHSQCSASPASERAR